MCASQLIEYMYFRTEHYISDFADDMITSNGIKPNFYLIPYDIEIMQGQIVRFECRVSGRPEPDIIWFKNDSRIYDCEHYKCIVNEEGNYALLIMGADAQDSATYRCVATNAIGQASFTVNLNVIERELTIAPKFMERFQNTNAKEGESIVLRCRAIGTPTPQLSWQKDGIQIDSNPPYHEIKIENDASVLCLNSVSARDAGWYQCTAQNQVGSVATRARLNVESTYQLPRGEPIKLVFPKTHRRIEPETEQYETVTLRHVQKVYEHYSSVDYDTSASTAVQQGKPVFSTQLRDVELVKGGSAHFEAHLSSFDYSDLIIEWYLNDRLLDSSDSRVITTSRYGYVALTLMNVDIQDSGIITCKVRNSSGQAVTSAALKCSPHAQAPGPAQYLDRYENVEDSQFYRVKREIEETRSKIAPNFVRPLESSISVQAGYGIVLEAQVTPVNDASLRIEWCINGQPLPSDSRRISTTFNFGHISLRIADVQPADSGLYMVKATNASGEASCTSSLKVLQGKTLLLIGIKYHH